MYGRSRNLYGLQLAGPCELAAKVNSLQRWARGGEEGQASEECTHLDGGALLGHIGTMGTFASSGALCASAVSELTPAVHRLPRTLTLLGPVSGDASFRAPH